MDQFDYLIVGGGLAAASAVDGIRSRDDDGSILLLSDESEPPYHRPPLSKEFLQHPQAGRDLLHVKPENWFEEEAGVTLRQKQRVISLDPRELGVTTAGGEVYRADRILLATGGRPRTLAVSGSDLERVFTLRTVDDAEAIRAAAADEGTEEALLIGSGFIGMELAASLSELGVRATIVEARERVWPTMLPPRVSAFLQDTFEARDVRFRLGTTVSELRGDDGVRSALLDDGAEVACQLVVVGVGIIPNDELAAQAGLGVKDGIVTDRYGETSH
ncbi:MAG: NAD(P)/FAD-dependent oxidoreductase, partial [Gemmatimonadota bacterium]|nr:NAD(P)/FAD-dependent oxidoreductase [Gemmatimonadota bacterium]